MRKVFSITIALAAPALKNFRLGLAVTAVLWIAIADPGFAQPIQVSTTVENIIGHRKSFDNPAVDAVQSYLLIDVSVVDIIPNGTGDGVKWSAMS